MKNLFHLLVILVLITSFTATAQLIHRDLLQKSSQQLAQTLITQGKFKPFPQSPQGWREILPDSIIIKLIERGETALKKDFKNIPATVMLEFVRNGNRTDYEKLSFEKRNQLWDLVLAESVEGKGRFTDKIVDGIWSISEESFWGISAHVGAQKAGAGLPDVQDPIVDLFDAETSAVMAWTDYFVGPQLDKVSKLVRPRIRYEIERRTLNPMLTAKYGWMGGGNTEAKLNNWAPWIASNYLAATLLIEHDETKRLDAVNRAIRIVDQYMDGLGVDGGCEEGPSYWTAAGGCVYDVLNLLYDATGGKLNIYHDPFIQKMGSYIYKTHISGEYFINVADAHPTLKPDGIMIYRFGKDMDYQPMMSFGSWAYHGFAGEDVGYEQFHRTRGLYNMAAIKAVSAYPAKETDVADAWYSDVQLMASRSNNGLFISSHGGTNGESHNHNDVGDFTVYADGYPVIIDVGSGTYTARTFGKDRYKLWFNTSPYHNLPTINGQEQGAGLQFAATAVQYKQGGNTSELSMDIAKAYPAAAGIKSWQRTVKMDKAKGVEVDDKYEAVGAVNNLTQSFMSVCDVDVSTPGKITFTLPSHNKVYLDYDAALWSANKEKMVLESPEDQGLKHSWEGKDIWRILLTCKKHDATNVAKYLVHK
jgi:hypothetical protein